MLKLTFEGNSVAELHDSINSYLGEAAAGGTPVGAATSTTNKKKTPPPAPTKAETTIEDVTNAFVKSSLDRQGKINLLAEFNCAKVGELEPKEYDDFIARINAA